VRQLSGGIKNVKLKRISSESMAEQRRIFELINEAKNASVRHRAPDIHKMLEDILEEWSQELMSQHKHDEALAENLVRKDSQSQAVLRQIGMVLTRTIEGDTDVDGDAIALHDAATFWQKYNNAFYSAFWDSGVNSGSHGQANVYTSFRSQVRALLRSIGMHTSMLLCAAGDEIFAQATSDIVPSDLKRDNDAYDYGELCTRACE